MNTDIIKQRLAELQDRKRAQQAELEAYDKLPRKLKMGRINNFPKILKEALLNGALKRKDNIMAAKIEKEFDSFYTLYLEDKVKNWNEYLSYNPNRS